MNISNINLLGKFKNVFSTYEKNDENFLIDNEVVDSNYKTHFKNLTDCIANPDNKDYLDKFQSFFINSNVDSQVPNNVDLFNIYETSREIIAANFFNLINNLGSDSVSAETKKQLLLEIDEKEMMRDVSNLIPDNKMYTKEIENLTLKYMEVLNIPDSVYYKTIIEINDEMILSSSASESSVRIITFYKIFPLGNFMLKEENRKFRLDIHNFNVDIKKEALKEYLAKRTGKSEAESNVDSIQLLKLFIRETYDHYLEILTKRTKTLQSVNLSHYTGKVKYLQGLLANENILITGKNYESTTFNKKTIKNSPAGPQIIERNINKKNKFNESMENNEMGGFVSDFLSEDFKFASLFTKKENTPEALLKKQNEETKNIIVIESLMRLNEMDPDNAKAEENRFRAEVLQDKNRELHAEIENIKEQIKNRKGEEKRFSKLNSGKKFLVSIRNFLAPAKRPYKKKKDVLNDDGNYNYDDDFKENVSNIQFLPFKSKVKGHLDFKKYNIKDQFSFLNPTLIKNPIAYLKSKFSDMQSTMTDETYKQFISETGLQLDEIENIVDKKEASRVIELLMKRIANMSSKSKTLNDPSPKLKNQIPIFAISKNTNIPKELATIGKDAAQNIVAKGIDVLKTVAAKNEKGVEKNIIKKVVDIMGQSKKKQGNQKEEVNENLRQNDNNIGNEIYNRPAQARALSNRYANNNNDINIGGYSSIYHVERIDLIINIENSEKYNKKIAEMLPYSIQFKEYKTFNKFDYDGNETFILKQLVGPNQTELIHLLFKSDLRNPLIRSNANYNPGLTRTAINLNGRKFPYEIMSGNTSTLRIDNGYTQNIILQYFKENLSLFTNSLLNDKNFMLSHGSHYNNYKTISRDQLTKKNTTTNSIVDEREDYFSENISKSIFIYDVNDIKKKIMVDNDEYSKGIALSILLQFSQENIYTEIPEKKIYLILDNVNSYSITPF